MTPRSTFASLCSPFSHLVRRCGLALPCALLAATAVPSGCGNAMDAAPSDTFSPPPAGQGFQYSMTSTITAGQEIERCQFIVAPPEGFYVNHDQVRYTPGSHHVLLYMTNYTAIPTQDRQGHPHDVSGVFDCANGATADWETTGVLSGAQSAAADSMVHLPPDVGIKVTGGTVLLMNTHYLNASPNDVEATARINIYTMPAEQVKTEGGVILFYNPFIRVPAMGMSTARMRCPVSQNLMLANIQSHMHRRGVGYVATLRDDKGAPIEDLYENDQWENVPVKSFGAGKALAAGSSIDYHCDYANSETRTVLQGFSTRDEMCVLLGSYYPRDPQFEACVNPTYIGSGTKDGQATLSCVQAATDNESMYGCIVDSCPGIADPMTKGLGCQFSQGLGTCDSICASDPSQCQSCIQQACQQQLTALAQATC